MSSLFTPARLPLTSSSADHDAGDDAPHHHHHRHDPDPTLQDTIHLQYDYLRSLIGGQRTSSRAKSTAPSTVFCVNLPPSIALPGQGGRYTSLGRPGDDSMATVDEDVVKHGAEEDSVPSSPPELAYSKSSKSSSSLTSEDDLSEASFSETTSQFEEVSLDHLGRDSVEDRNLPPEDRPTLQRPTRKSMPRGDQRKISSSPPSKQRFYEERAKFPSLQSAVNGVLRDQSLNLPHGSRMHRAATSPTSPYTTRNFSPRMSRSPSPNPRSLQKMKPFSPPTSSSTTPKASVESARQSPGARRMSWQPGRKSVKELEAECNDEDDEVPDEAILENVPMSPMPGQSSFLRSPSFSAVRSTTPSPQRRPSYANLHSANIPKGARRPSAPPAPHLSRSPRSPMRNRPPFPHGNTIGASPSEVFAPKHRSKSWTEDLNLEARQLSRALEQYAEELSTDKRDSGPRSGTSSVTSSPPRPNVPKRAKTGVELPTVPPVQKGNIMIDPFPISKEKEAVLTRTRPSWLPPKSQKEEKKHLKEFQQMMARAAEAEKKRAVKDQEAREDREEMQGSIARIWEQHVLPNWDTVIKEPHTRELWWRGVTPQCRGEVWQRAVSNDLELSAASYEAALARANALQARVDDMIPEERTQSQEAAWLEAIGRDVPTVYPELQMFTPGAPLHSALHDVLKAYAMYRSDIGYVYGTHLVAGIICLLLPAPRAFVVLANLLNRPLPLAFLVHDTVAMAHAHDLVLSTLKYKFPQLHAHLTSPPLGLHPAEYLDPLFRCLFAYNLPHRHVCRVWDIFVFEGDRALIRAAVAVLGRLEGRLYGSKQEILDLISWRCEARWEVGDEEEFVRSVREAGKVDGKGEVRGA